jgi:HAD superfamily hydrolase (TIGR01509 family)
MNETRLVIFDCDGVLVDSEPLANAVLHAELRRLGVELTLAESTALFTGLSLRSCLAIIEDRLGGPPPREFMPRLRAGVIESFRRDLRAVPGVGDVLMALKPPRCVASSGSHEKIRFSLGLTGLDGFFDDARIFSADDVARGKPAPDLFLHAAHRMGAEPAACVVIEDSDPGVEAARAAGMRVLGFAARSDAAALTAAGAERAFHDMRELPSLI